MAYWFYNLLLTLFSVLFLPVLAVLLLSGERFRKGILQRLGFYPRAVIEPVLGSRPIWIHAVSVGEVLSLRRLAGEIKERFPGRKILLSTFTATGNQIARQSGVGDAVIFFPLDHPWIVRRALETFDPSLVVILETEIWPNFLRLAHARGIPTLLLSGRLSPAAFRWYRLLRFFFAAAVRRFSAAGMQSEGDAERMAALGLDSGRTWITGSLKHASEDAGEAKRAQGEMGLPIVKGDGRQVLVAGSTHRGEEEVLLEA
ncbi:MAG: 3-deoxy-D-manno-octulosonic acid transferase, partial [Deltaproteobacteria bacterium]|nr:3-deoxy-D-manno-octulosonic acid transferase [Deltaproteobacteria bacterium]